MATLSSVALVPLVSPPSAAGESDHFHVQLVPMSTRPSETMSAGTPAMPKDFARRLLGHEAAARKTSSSETSPAFAVCDQLRGPLGKVIGVEGYSTLLRRALVLASNEVSWLRALQINANGSLIGLEEQEALLGAPSAAAEGEVVLVGHLLGLLVTFIGPALTLRLLHEIWPDWTITIFEETKAL